MIAQQKRVLYSRPPRIDFLITLTLSDQQSAGNYESRIPSDHRYEEHYMHLLALTLYLKALVV